jgi:ankyrin repeat protein
MITDHGITALIYAAREGHAEPVTALLSGVSNPQQLAEQRGVFENTALMWAADNGHAVVVKKILEFVDDTEKLIFQVNNEGLNCFDIFGIIFSLFGTSIICNPVFF